MQLLANIAHTYATGMPQHQRAPLPATSTAEIARFMDVLQHARVAGPVPFTCSFSRGGLAQLAHSRGRVWTCHRSSCKCTRVLSAARQKEARDRLIADVNVGTPSHAATWTVDRNCELLL